MQSADPYADIWRLLKEYNFEIDHRSIVRDLLCCICQGLLRNAQEGPCGCLYCCECIAAHLDADEKYCPGKWGHCGQLVIHMTGQLHQQLHSVNERVASISVPCPIAFCEVATKLRLMRAHIEKHYRQTDADVGNGIGNGDIGAACGDVAMDLLKLRQEMAAMRDTLQRNARDLQRHEKVTREIRCDLDNILADVARFSSLMVGTMTTASGNERATGDVNCGGGGTCDARQDDIEWEIEIDNDMDDLGECDVPHQANTIDVTSLSPSPSTAAATAVHRCQRRRSNITAFIRSEVHRQMNEYQRLHPPPMSPMECGEFVALATSDVLVTDAEVTSSKVAVVNVNIGNNRGDASSGDVIDVMTASSIGVSGRRKLKRTLPTQPLAPVSLELVSPPLAPVSLELVSPPLASVSLELVSTPAESPQADLPQTTAPPLPMATKTPTPTGTPTPIKVYIKTQPKPSIRAPVVKVGIVRTIGTMAPARNNTGARLRRGFTGDKWSRGRASVWRPMGQRSVLPPPSLASPGSGGGAGIQQPQRSLVTPFEFRIDAFSTKITQARLCDLFSGGVGNGPSGASSNGGSAGSIYSPSFYAGGGYRLCLRVEPHSRAARGYLGVFFCLMRGVHDDRLAWPLRAAITVSLLDQRHHTPYTSRSFDHQSAPDTLKHVFQRPAVDGAFWFGTPHFIHFDFLYGKAAALVLDDSVVIHCSIDI